MASPLRSGADVSIDVHAAHQLIRSGHRYRDVRTEEEFKKGHVENSLNIPYMFNTPQGRVKNPKFLEQVSSACGKEEKLIVGCQSGARSLHATTDLLAAVGEQLKQSKDGHIANWLYNIWTKDLHQAFHMGPLCFHCLCHPMALVNVCAYEVVNQIQLTNINDSRY